MFLYYKKAIHLIKTIVKEPFFTQKEIENEKRVVLQEYMQDEDNVVTLSVETACTALLKNTPYEKSVKGSTDDLKNATANDLRAFYNKYYKTCKVIINSPKQYQNKISKLVQKSFTYLDLNSFSINSQMSCDNTPVQYVEVKRKQLTQYSTAMVFKGFGCTDERNIIIDFVWELLTGNINALLTFEMREKRGLVYKLTSFNETWKHTGITGIHFSSTISSTSKILTYILSILNKLKNKGIPETILNYSKKSYLNKLKYKLTNWVFTHERNVTRSIYDSNITEELIIKTIQKLTNDDIMNISKIIFNIQHVAVISVGNYKNTSSVENSIRRVFQLYS
jgi:predicted Zn-dependent peptidase